MKRTLALVLALVTVAATSCGAPTGLSAEHQELAAYLSSMYRIQGDQMSAMTGLGLGSEALEASSQEELLAQQQETNEQMGALFKQYVADLKTIDPPERAADFHAQVITRTERAVEETILLLDDLSSGDIDVMLDAQQQQAALIQEMFADSQALVDELAVLVGEVLAGRDDPETVYILELLTVLSAGSIEAARELLANLDTLPTTPEEVGALIEQAVELFKTVRDEHATIIPPDAWADLHAERTAILDDGIVLYTRFGEIAASLFEDPESVDIVEFEQIFKDLLDWAVRTPEWTAAFAHRLADFFEGLA